MDFGLSEEQRLIVETTRAFVENELYPHEREVERTGVLRHSTRTSGSFSYEISLPSPVDDQGVTATLDGGVLTVRVPKSSDAKTTRVEIK